MILGLIFFFFCAFELTKSQEKIDCCYGVYRWYVGIRSEPDDDEKKCNIVIQGKAEKISGLKDIHVVSKMNHLSTLDAWTLEYSIIKEMMSKYNSKTFNKSVKFGLGPLPKKIKQQKYTITLIRGRKNHNSYKAYENKLPDTIDELVNMVNIGEEAKSTIVKYVDKLTSTWNLKSPDEGEYEYFFIYTCSNLMKKKKKKTFTSFIFI